MIDTDESRQAQRELQQLVDAVPQHIVVLNGEGSRLYGNQAACNYHGLTAEQFLVEPITNCFHPDDVQKYSRVRDSGIANGESWEAEVRLRRKDGLYRWFLIRGKPFRNEHGRVARWYLTRTDIEERKVAELELRRLIDVVPQYIRVDDKDGKVLYANERLLDYFGLTLKELQASDFRTRVCHPDDLDRVRLAREDAMSRGVGWEVEARILRKDGQYRWFLNRYNPLRDEQGNIVRWYATGTDIDDRKQAERELQQLVDAVPQHIVMHSADGRRLYANKVSLDFLGRTLQEFLDETKSPPFHPDDVASFFEARQRGISSGMPFEMEARLRRSDGEYRWFLFRYSPHRNEHGEITGWYSTGTDIEDRKRAEQELCRKTETLAIFQKLVQSSMEGILAFDSEGRYTVWNPALERIFGINELQRLGKQASDLCPFFHLTGGVNCYRDALAGKGVLATDIPYVFAETGKEIFLDARFSPLMDEGGNTIGGLAIIRDVTERKRADDALRRSEERLRLLLEFTNKLNTNLDLRALLRVASQSLRKVIKCDLIGVFLPHSDGENLRSFVIDFPESKGHLREELQVSVEKRPMTPEYPLAAMVFRTGKPWVGNDDDLRQLGFKNTPGLAEGLKTGCVLPILCCDRVLGVLGLGRREPNSFDAYEVDLLRQVADQMAIAIVNALAVEDRRQAENALRRSEAYLEEAQELSHTGSFAHDVVQNEIVYWSAQSYRNFGFDPANGPVRWEEARARIQPDDRQKIDECQQKAIQEKTRSAVDFRVILPDGSVRHIHSQCRPMLDAENEAVELVGTNVDVTEQYTSRMALEKALEENKRLRDELYRENLALKEEIDQSSMFEEIVGTSDALRRVLVQVAKVAPADSTVLITGETGTGKELIARAIHKRSERSSRAFVSVNCAAIPATLIGSELFGHEKGAFTGATQRRLGRFELADGGTLFLDEVGDLPAETQIALLRVLQEQQFERIGGTQPISVDVRIIAATNRDLKAAISAATFRSDLFYRLNVFPIAVPPLRKRKDDIPLLVQYLTERYASKAGKKIKNIHKKTLELFQAYDWPGNIRELQNVIERAVILCDGETFSVDESWLQPESPHPSLASDSLARPGAERERELIETALAETKGRIAGPLGAAAKLGIPRSTLETKIRKLGIRKHRFNST